MDVKEEIVRESKRLIVRHETKGRLIYEENVRRARRSTAEPEQIKHVRPYYWTFDDGFNPYLTRARAERIAHSVRGHIRDRSYQPRSPFAFEIPKPNGDKRQVCIYQVADGAMSKMIFERVLNKNLPILSSRAYAYRKDLSAQNAIQYVKSEFSNGSRLYVAEYDFSKFFEMIDHDHVRRILAEQFLLTPNEVSAIEGFLRVSPSIERPYEPEQSQIRERGIPQGTSISLLLANVAAWELDRGLERVGVGFVRYADDTLIWSNDYGRICEAANLLHQHAETIGVEINSTKSPGIRLLVPENTQSEMRCTYDINYLGYQLGLGTTTMKKSAIDKIKKRINQLIYWGLLFEPLSGTQDGSRITNNVDRDYVSVIWRIRRYLYGDLSEKAVTRYKQRGAPLRRFKGVMSAYPLIDDNEELLELDNWIFNRLFLAIRKRSRLLRSQGFGPSLPMPHDASRSDLRSLQVVGASSGQNIDLSVPSVRKIAEVIRAAAGRYGPSVVGQIDTYRY